MPSVNMRGLSKRFYYDFPPYGIVPLAKASKEGKELRASPRKRFLLVNSRGGEGNHFEKGCKRAKENSWDENGKSKPIEGNEK